MAIVWRSTYGVTFFRSNEGQVLEAVTMCLARMYRTPSPLRRPPRALGSNISVCAFSGSFNQFFNTALVCLVSGVHRSFRPFPVQRT
jgi:hypothetical protein